MKDARYTAVQALMRMQTADAYSNLVIDSLTLKNGLDARDAAFARALFYTALERLVSIDHMLSHYCRQPLATLAPPVLGTLRAGVCQLVYLGGVDEYAAVNESVKLTKKLGQMRAAGLVNAVLRSILRDGKKMPPVQGGIAAQLAVEYSCPAWLIETWLSGYGEAAALRVLKASLGKPPLYLRANTLKIDAPGLVECLKQENIAAQCDTEISGCVSTEAHVAVENLHAFGQGLFHVQDKSSQICAAAVGARPGERVLDLCAAPGGKSFTMAQQMENSGELIARDLHEKRARLVEKGARRLGIGNISASAGDASQVDTALGFFDRVLCDVPCSGFGVIRRKPEIKYKTPESIQKLPDIQYKILQTASQYLKPGGTLVYSTCTLLPAENEQVAARFLAENAGFGQISQKTYTGAEFDSDGFFVTVFQKSR